MEREILAEIVTIKWLLVGLFGVIALMCLSNIINNVISHRMLSSSIDLRMRDILIAQAQMHDSKGENKDFLDTAEKLIDLYPNDVNAIWYFALANYKNNHLGSALSALAEIKDIDPAWGKDMVDEYISVIKSEMDGPKRI